MTRSARVPLFLALALASPVALVACADQSSEDAVGDADADADAGSDDEGLACADAPTWHQDVAPIVSEHCTGCHVADGIAPMALTDYKSSKDFAFWMAARVESGEMPPFLARDTDECVPRHGWRDDPRLSPEETTLLREWADCGSPEGDAATAAPLPPPPATDLEDADVEMVMKSPVEVGGTKDSFECLVLDEIESTRYLSGMQIMPGNGKVVHHVLVWADKSGEAIELGGDDARYPCFATPETSNFDFIGAWAPGMAPMLTPQGVGIALDAGSRIVLNVHYHPTGGGVETDSATSVRLRYMDTFPSYFGINLLIGNFDGPEFGGDGLLPDPENNNETEFLIPANSANHVEWMRYTLDGSLPDKIRLWAVGSHMHYVGTDMSIGIHRPVASGTEPDSECLIQTPDWDFNWQRFYAYDAPVEELPLAKPGDQLYLRCTYNNTMDNEFVAEALSQQGFDAPQDVYLGETTLDEMCLGLFGVAVAVEDL